MKATSKTKKSGLVTRAKPVKTKKASRKRKTHADNQQYVDSDMKREIPWRPQYKSKAADEEG